MLSSGWWGSWRFYFSWISVDGTVFYWKHCCFHHSPKELFLKLEFENHVWGKTAKEGFLFGKESGRQARSCLLETFFSPFTQMSNVRLPHSVREPKTINFPNAGRQMSTPPHSQPKACCVFLTLKEKTQLRGLGYELAREGRPWTSYVT